MTQLEKQQLEMYLGYFDTDKTDRLLENSSLAMNIMGLLHNQLMRDIPRYHGNGKKVKEIQNLVRSISNGAMMVLAQIQTDLNKQ